MLGQAGWRLTIKHNDGHVCEHFFDNHDDARQAVAYLAADLFVSSDVVAFSFDPVIRTPSPSMN